MAQQQALLNQAIQGQQHIMWGFVAFEIAGLLIGGWVLYMFYARLRDIAEELMKFRVAYEFANPPKSVSQGSLTTKESAANPFQSGGDARYKPK
jgi:hypothetical protein